MNNLMTLFNSEDKNEIKTAVKELILKQVERDFEDNSNYLINPNEIEDMISEVIDELREEIKEKYRDIIIKQLEEKLKEI